MNNDDGTKTSAQDDYREGDARFDVTSINEVKDENGNGIFHMTTRFKWILALSILLLLMVGVLVYSVYMGALAAEIWQLALWIICGLMAVYSVVKKSLVTLILNLILFFGVSLIPVWQSAHENFKSVFELFFG